MKAQTILGLGLLEIMAQDETQKRLAKELGAALTKLINKGGTLEMIANPPHPFGFADVTQAGQPDLTKLGISIQTK